MNRRTLIRALPTTLVGVTAAASPQEPPPRAPASPSSAQTPPAPPRPQTPQVTSPEVSPDRKITFRIWAPHAEKIGLQASDIPMLAGEHGMHPEFTKGDDGVWQTTIGPIDPGAYRYTFTVDGVGVVDPRNAQYSQSNNSLWSLVLVPGSDLIDLKQVPHGVVASVDYYSNSLGRFRRMHVYTPPRYETNQQKYPIFYLLHGASDSDDSWSTVGRANVILDNLIAANKVKPMIVVMPAGHTTRYFGPRRPPGEAGGPPPRDEFLDDFVGDIMPYAEKNYRVLADREHRAIAGLSMGGSQTMNIAFSHLDKFTYIGVFSSGILGNSDPSKWESDHAAMLDDATLKKGVKLLWFSTGSEDRLLPNSKNTVALLNKHGFDAKFEPSPGGHTWINWRNYLSQFSPQLFQ